MIPGLTATLARFTSATEIEVLPKSVVEAAKIAILDGVANALAGSTQPVAEIVTGYVRDMGGVPECTAAGTELKTSAPLAAFANGVFMHCLDFEIQGQPPAHGTSSILPAVLALAERHGAAGLEIIEAYVIGWEVQQRLRAAGRKADLRGFHPPGVFGPLAAAAASARVLRLSEQQIRVAFGIAASRTGGLFANNGTMVKATHPGNAARLGLEAALLARAGFTANESVLEARQGWIGAFFGGDFDPECVSDGLGLTWSLTDPGFNIKRYPAEIYMQWPIDAVVALRETHDIRADDVAELVIEVPGGHPDLSRPRPASGLDGKFSFEYCAAVAMVEGAVGIDAFSDATRYAPRVEAMLAKVRLLKNPNIPRDPLRIWVNATVRLHDGRELTQHCRSYRGSIANPMTRDERLAKFRDCARRVIPESGVERLRERLESLDKLTDVRALMALLARPG